MRNLIYRVRLWFEWMYLHIWKDTTDIYKDDKTGKWKKCKHKTCMKEVTYDWYNGTWSILQAMDQRIRWIHYRLRKDGCTSKSYITSGEFFKLASKEDKEDLLLKMYTRFKNGKDIQHLEYFNKVEDCENKPVKKRYWIDTLNVDRMISDDGYMAIYVEVTRGNYFQVVAVTKSLAKKQPKNPKWMEMSVADNGDINWSPAKVYETKSIQAIGDMFVPSTSKDFYEHLESLLKSFEFCGVKFSIEDPAKCLVDSIQTIHIKPWELKSLHDGSLIRDAMRGQLWDLRGLCHLHHLIRKVESITDSDEKYCGWMHVSGEDKKQEALKESQKMYQNDLQSRYRELFDYMYNKHNEFWD